MLTFVLVLVAIVIIIWLVFMRGRSSAGTSANTENTPYSDNSIVSGQDHSGFSGFGEGHFGGGGAGGSWDQAPDAGGSDSDGGGGGDGGGDGGGGGD